MTVELKDNQYALAWHTMARIATGQDEDGGRLTREQMVTMAREACDQLKWRYGIEYLRANTALIGR